MRLILFIAAYFSFLDLAAQEAVITYDVTLKSTDESIQNKMSFMEDSKLILSYAPDQLREDEIWGDSMITSTHVYNAEIKQGLLYLNGITGKMGALFDFDQFTTTDYEIEYTEAVKDLAGYACKKAIIHLGQNEIIYWYTDQLEQPTARSKFIYEDVTGVPLHFIKSTADHMFEYKVTNLNLTPEIMQKSFELVIPEDYTEQPYKELKQLLLSN